MVVEVTFGELVGTSIELLVVTLSAQVDRFVFGKWRLRLVRVGDGRVFDSIFQFCLEL